jgi:hypothetical protein
MKYLSKLFLLATIAVTLFTACDKVDSLPYYASGTASGIGVVLNASTTTLAVAPADSSKTAITFTWNFPNYATNASTAKYILEIDSSGRNFTKSISTTYIGTLSASYTGLDINNILLGFGFTIGTAYNVDIRVTASYGNNNDQIKSNVVTVKMTPYKVPPKVALPTSGRLFLVGDATQGGWNNPVPTPSQEFARLDETTFAGVFKLNGGKQYLVLPVNGDWSAKFAVDDNTIAGLSAGGSFGFNVGSAFNANFPGPATSGYYKIVLDFQAGKFAVTPYTSTLPDSLYMVGDATPGGWGNPVPTPSQQFTRSNSVEFTLTLNNLVGGKQYLFLPVNGDWTNKYAVSDNSITGLSAGGDFGYNLPQNFPGPAVSGNYNIYVNFATLKFKTTKL